MAVGAGGAFTGGVNRLPPVGLIDFSVGATGGGAGVAGGVVVVVVVVVVDVSGAFGSSLAQEAVKPTIVTTAAPPASAAIRRPIRPMISSYLPDQCRPLKINLANETLIECLNRRTGIAKLLLRQGLKCAATGYPALVVCPALPARWSPCTNRYSIR
jgi:hypothetical protein